MKNHKEKSGMTRNFIKLMLCTLSVTSSPYFLHAGEFEPVRSEPVIHETSGMPKVDPNIKAQRQQQSIASADAPTTAQISRGNAKFEQDYITNKNSLTDLQAKYDKIIKDPTTKSYDKKVTQQALDRVNNELARQAPKIPTTHEGFDLDSTHIKANPIDEVPVTSTELTLFEPSTHEMNAKQGENSFQQEIITYEDGSINENLSNTQASNQFQEKIIAEAQQDPLKAAEDFLQVMDPNNILEKSDKDAITEEFKTGKKVSQTWSEWFKSLYKKTAQSMNNAIENAKGNKIIRTTDPTTNEQTTSVYNKNGVLIKSRMYDATGKILSTKKYDLTNNTVTISTYDQTGKIVNTATKANAPATQILARI